MSVITVSIPRPVVPRLRRLAGNTLRLARRSLRRAVSAALRLSWQVDVTVLVYAEVRCNDRDTAAQLFRQYLTANACQFDLVCPAHERFLGQGVWAARSNRLNANCAGWRTLASTPVTDLRDVAVDDNAHVDDGWPFDVVAAATARFTVAARDADSDMYVDLEPGSHLSATTAVDQVHAVEHTVTLTPARRRNR
jgi:hypothetical protein